MSNTFAGNKRFLMEIEQSIRVANKEIIHGGIPPITSDRILSFAVIVAKLRGQYIKAAFEFADANTSNEKQTTASIDELSLCRRQFEEARDAFIALQRAIELGYVSIE